MYDERRSVGRTRERDVNKKETRLGFYRNSFLLTIIFTDLCCICIHLFYPDTFSRG